MAGINEFEMEDVYLRDYEILGDYIAVQKVEETAHEIEVMISDIVTPYRFYVQLKKKQADLAAVFTVMQRFYSNTANHKIPEEYIILNQICAAKFPDDQVNKLISITTLH